MRADRTARAVAGVTVVALVARLLVLGERVAHFDEARVAWWTLEYAATGELAYRPIIHGPFLRIVNARVFALLGPTDAAMRLVPALVGGLLPLSALGLRSRLSDGETVALAIVLAFNPALLYYSRFSRGDPLVGAFAFVAFVAVVAGRDRRDPRLVVPAGLLLALALTVKENAVLYPVAWLGAALLVVDHRLLTGDGDATLGERVRAAGSHAATLAPYVLATTVLGLAVLVLFYAPRSPDPDAVALNNLAGDPSILVPLIEESLLGSAREFYGLWVQNRVRAGGANPYIRYLGALLKNVAVGGAATCALAAGGTALDRYSGDPRDLVQFGFYWGLLSLVGYPLASDLADAPWLAVHVLLPLSIPAAVGAVALYDAGVRARERGDLRRARAAAAVLLLVVATAGGTAVYTSYVSPDSPPNELAQYAQPRGDLGPTVDRMLAVSPHNDGTDVLFYGNGIVDGGEDVPRTPGCVRWFRALPLPWYLRAGDAEVACTTSEAELRERVERERPPFVVAEADVPDGTYRVPPELRSLDGYETRPHLLRQSEIPGEREWVVVLVREGTNRKS